MFNPNKPATTAVVNYYLCVSNLGKLFWYSLKKKKKIQIFQTKVLKIITNAP